MEYIAYSVLIIFGDIDGLFFNGIWSTYIGAGIKLPDWSQVRIFIDSFIIKLICC